MERFTSIYRNTDGWYSINCPVIIMAGALLFDAEEERLIVQLKLRKMTPKKITCCKVRVQAYANDEICETIDDYSYNYLDIKLEQVSEFGSQSPIILESEFARSFTAQVTELMYEDGETVRFDDEEWSTIPAMVRIDSYLKKPALVKVYQRECGSKYKYLPQKKGGLFLCSCGNINFGENSRCTECGKQYADFEPRIDIDYLSRIVEAQQEQVRKAARTAKKCLIVAVILALLGGIAYMAIPMGMRVYKYNYISSHLDATDRKTYDYLCELMREDYKDCDEIYNELYAWSVVITPVDDAGHPATSFSRQANAFHFECSLSGGAPGQRENLEIVLTIRNAVFREDWNNARTGNTRNITILRGNRGVSEGNGTVRVIDSEGNTLASAAVEFTN